MLRHLNAWKYWIGVVIIFGCAVFVSHQYQAVQKQCEKDCSQVSRLATSPSPSKENCTKCEENAERSFPTWYRLFGWPEGITAWAILLTLLAIVEQTHETRRAAESSERSVKASDKAYALAENTAKKQLRAYMVVRNARLILHQDGFVEAKMELANCGQTPAYDLRGGAFCRFTRYPIQNVPSMPKDLRQSQSTIGAGLAFHMLPPGGRHDSGNRDHLLRKLETEGNNLVYCANGYFTYRDIFNDPHWFKFQLIVGGPGGVRLDSDATGQVWASFSNDSEGNEEDQPQNPN